MPALGIGGCGVKAIGMNLYIIQFTALPPGYDGGCYYSDRFPKCDVPRNMATKLSLKEAEQIRESLRWRDVPTVLKRVR